MYTYHCHNTKHVHIPLSQHKTCKHTTVTIQNMYTYHCHSTKHVHVPLSQHKTCTCTTNYSKFWCILSVYWSCRMFPCGNIKFRSYHFNNLTRLDDMVICIFIWTMKYFFCIHFMNVCVHDCNTFKTILVVEFLLLILNLKKKNPKFPRVPPFEKHCPKEWSLVFVCVIHIYIYTYTHIHIRITRPAAKITLSAYGTYWRRRE